MTLDLPLKTNYTSIIFILTLLLSAGLPHAEAQNHISTSSTPFIGDIYHISGNVGIGTATPTEKLQVSGSIGWGNTGAVLSTNHGASIKLRGNNRPFIDFVNDLDTDYDARFILWSDDILELAGVDLGIGTSNPAAKLDVRGDMHTTGKFLFKGSTSLYSIGVQDGTGAVQHYWNATGGVTPKYIVGTDAGKIHFSLGSPVIYSLNWADGNGANANDPITWKPYFNVRSNGNVGIGTEDTYDYKLAVNGTIGAKEVNVESTSPWPDYVFDENYHLPKLSSIETYVKQNKHLPGIPNAEDVAENGVALGEMNRLLLEKVEELTLYLLEEHKNNQKLRQDIEQLKQEIADLKTAK